MSGILDTKISQKLHIQNTARRMKLDFVKEPKFHLLNVYHTIKFLSRLRGTRIADFVKNATQKHSTEHSNILENVGMSDILKNVRMLFGEICRQISE